MRINRYYKSGNSARASVERKNIGETNSRAVNKDDQESKIRSKIASLEEEEFLYDKILKKMQIEEDEWEMEERKVCNDVENFREVWKDDREISFQLEKILESVNEQKRTREYAREEREVELKAKKTYWREQEELLYQEMNAKRKEEGA